jgi:hypothetical protein
MKWWKKLFIFVACVGVCIGCIIGLIIIQPPNGARIESHTKQIEDLEDEIYPVVVLLDKDAGAYHELRFRSGALQQSTKEVEALWAAIPPGTSFGNARPGKRLSIRSWQELAQVAFKPEGPYASTAEKVRTIGRAVLAERVALPKLQRSITRERMRVVRSPELEPLVARHGALAAQLGSMEAADRQWRWSFFGGLKIFFGVFAAASGILSLALVAAFFDPDKP